MLTVEPSISANAIGHGSQASRLNQKVRAFCADIKVSHTVFAMPFALLSTFLAAGGMPKAGQLFLILICMVTARTAAMAMNRLLDAAIDARNPRTSRRAIPSGALSRGFVIGALAICVAVFITATGMFWVMYRNRWPLILGVPVLIWLCAYPLLKRFTRLCHYYLGMSLALAPVCAWIAITGHLAPPPLWMALAVTSWTAGFDIIYACQDYQTDCEQGIFSVPAKLGIGPALWVARLTHVFSFFMLIQVGRSAHPPLGTFYFIGVAIAGMLLLVEHLLVKANDLSKVGLAFFTVNGIISMLLAVLGAVDIFTR
jgi:4-hydroxybenzoate polyprenyltransferase